MRPYFNSLTKGAIVMKYIFTFFMVLIAGAAMAAPPDTVLVEYDVYGGYGQAVLDAIDALWPSATVDSHNGDWAGFIADLNAGDYDVVICEAHNYTSFTPSDFQALADYYNDGGRVFYADWYMSGGYANVLFNALGVNSASGIYMPPVTHYTWDTSSLIVQGVSDWTYGDPGYGVGGNRLTVGTADPVTGWTASETSGQGGICCAPDGYSICSGYFPSLNTSDPEGLWTNILNYMWPNNDSIQPTSLGKLKAQFN